jgi:hypothetical protein
VVRFTSDTTLKLKTTDKGFGDGTQTACIYERDLGAYTHEIRQPAHTVLIPDQGALATQFRADLVITNWQPARRANALVDIFDSNSHVSWFCMRHQPSYIGFGSTIKSVYWLA